MQRLAGCPRSLNHQAYLCVRYFAWRSLTFTYKFTYSTRLLIQTGNPTLCLVDNFRGKSLKDEEELVIFTIEEYITTHENIFLFRYNIQLGTTKFKEDHTSADLEDSSANT